MVNALELDLLGLARSAAGSGNGELRRAVMLLARKRRASELGDQLRSVCLEHGIPVEASAAHDSQIQSPEVLRAKETLDGLIVLAQGDSEKLQDYRVALDFVLGDFGAKIARGQLGLLLRKGDLEAAITIANFMSQDARKTYASAGRQFLKDVGGG